MKKRLITALLALTMVLGLLSGCGSSSSSADEAGSTSAVSASEEAAPVAEAEEEAPAEEDVAPAAEAEVAPEAEGSAMEETTIPEDAPAEEIPEEEEDPIAKYITPTNIEELIAGRPSVSLPVADEGTSLTFWTGSPSQDATISGWNDSTAAIEMEARTGVHIDYIEVAPPTQSESINLMFASGDYPDILNYDVTSVYSISYLVANDIAVDLADMLEEHAPSYSALMEADPALYLATVDDEGQVGGLAGYQYNYYVTTGALVRGDWLTEVGMTTDDLVTFDDFHEYLTQVKNAGLCEGPLPIRFDGAISSNPFIAAMGGRLGASDESSPKSFFYDENGDMVYGYTSDIYKEYITMMAQWYQEGLICKDLMTSDRLDSSDIAGGKFAIMWQDCQFMDSWIEAGQVNDPDFDLVGVSEPLLEEGQTVGFQDICTISINLVITSACPDPVVALEWLDYHFSEEGSILCQYGLEGEGLAYDENGDPDYSELISNNPDGLSTDNALNAYAININMYAKNGAKLRAAYNENQQAALNEWNDHRETTESSFIYLFTLNEEETETVSKYYTDISTYVAEQVGRFLIGESDIEENWDTFVETVNSMGMDEVIACYTEAGERYFSRMA